MKAYERFLKYVAYPTMSDGASETVPSTAKQLVLGKALCEELRQKNMKDIPECSYAQFVQRKLPEVWKRYMQSESSKK